jgi:hypothetical protein
MAMSPARPEPGVVRKLRFWFGSQLWSSAITGQSEGFWEPQAEQSALATSLGGSDEQALAEEVMRLERLSRVNSPVSRSPLPVFW